MMSAHRFSDVRHSQLLGSLSFLPARRIACGSTTSMSSARRGSDELLFLCLVPDRPKSPAAIAIEAVHHGAPGDVVAIYKLIANGSFAPDEIAVMRAAYEAALGMSATNTIRSPS